MNKKNIILHGHFYQPPREDPWTGVIEHQKSSEPFSNWNFRITEECYAACAYSRVLDKNGAIEIISNNYRYLSFNFGPTLLSWLEDYSPNVYQRIIDADKESELRLGFGNAVAQSYNHTILPLDSRDDARTQIRWGLIDFEHRFGRRADGMWLPECGVNDYVLDLLIAEGMKYVILSPWQACSIENDDGDMSNLTGRPAPSNQAFLIKRPGGSIAAFFYNPDLASGISFGHLLRSREGLESTLRKALENEQGKMINIATDGEIYGHHEPFGDMCLSSLADQWGDKGDLAFTNYAEYLSRNPAVQEVKLHKGKDGLGTSWSCAHGVERWIRDCGCKTGGNQEWNQKWRSPLRTAFNRLRDKALQIWTLKVEGITQRNSRDVLDNYAAVMTGAMSQEDFLAANTRMPLTAKKHEELFRMLEGAKFLQFMYTSCGWFFSEISGIEPVQNIRYAYRGAELIDRKGQYGLIALLSDGLKQAKSNIENFGNGYDLLCNVVVPANPPEVLAASLLFWRHLYNLPNKSHSRWGAWKDEDIQILIVDTVDGKLRLNGSISYTEPATASHFCISFKTVVDKRLFCPLIEVKSGKTWFKINISDMPKTLRLEIRNVLLNRSEKKLIRFMGKKFNDRAKDHRIMEALNVSYAVSGWQSLEISLHCGPLMILEKLARTPTKEWPSLIDKIDEMLTLRARIDMKKDGFQKQADALISHFADNLRVRNKQTELKILIRLLEVMHKHGLHPLRPQIQNTVFDLLDSGEKHAHHLADLARLLNINPQRYIKELLPGRP